MSTIDFTWRPVDTLYFGPPVSMAAGEVNHGRSLFPPPPMAFQGIVRTRLLAAGKRTFSLDDWSAAARKERAELVGGPDALPSGWLLAGPFPACLGRRVEPWFPTPRLALRGRDQEPGNVPARAHLVRSPHPACDDLDPAMRGDRSDVGAPERGAEEPVGGWVSARNLQWLLTGSGNWEKKGFGKDLPPFVKREPRTGLAVDQTSGHSIDGLLYTVSPLRMDPGSGFLGRLVVPASFSPHLDAAALTGGIATAGRGAKPVELQAAGAVDPAWDDLRSGKHLVETAKTSLFWLVALTPARMKDPREPLTWTPPGITVHAALVGPSIILGGLSMVGGDSRSNRAYVPAGSAWLIEIAGKPEERLAALRKLNDTPSIGDPEDHCFGFGHTLVGRYVEA